MKKLAIVAAALFTALAIGCNSESPVAEVPPPNFDPAAEAANETPETETTTEEVLPETEETPETPANPFKNVDETEGEG